MEYKHRIVMKGQNVKIEFTFQNNDENANRLCTSVSSQFRGEVTHTLSSQRAGVHSEESTYFGGERTEYDAPTRGSKEAFEIYFDMYPERRNHYVLVDGEYMLHSAIKEATA